MNQKKNLHQLLRYVGSRLNSTPVKESADVVSRDGVFVPSGWDSLAKINLLNEAAPLREDDDEKEAFNSHIARPQVEVVRCSLFISRSFCNLLGGVKIAEVKKDIVVEDEQEFLQRCSKMEGTVVVTESADGTPVTETLSSFSLFVPNFSLFFFFFFFFLPDQQDIKGKETPKGDKKRPEATPVFLSTFF